MNAAKLWRQYNYFRNSKVKQYAPAIYKALKAQLDYFIQTKNIDMIPMQPIAEVVKDIYVNTGRIWAHQTYLNVTEDAKVKKGFALSFQLKRRAPIGFNESFINDILQYFQVQLLTDAVLPMTETTKDWIRQSLSNGYAEGQSLDEIINNMLQSGILRRRANVIARTEVGKAASLGEELGVNKTGLLTMKRWISVNDKRTRFDHRETNGQVQPADEPFIVGKEGYEMMRPLISKSPTGQKIPAKEIVNCRCVIGRQVVRDSEGLPVMRSTN